MVEVILAREFWKENRGGGFATLTVICIIFSWKFSKILLSAISRRCRTTSDSISPPFHANLISSSGISELIPEGDLKSLIDNLDEKASDTEKWEHVAEKSKILLSYKAKCCKPKDGPIKYLSVTVFGNCSPELLRDFYMDCEYRKQWDKTLVDHEQLQIDEKSGIEIGRMIKKFPLLTQREYILAWRIWEGSNKTYYCFTKECDHSLASRQKKYVRVVYFRSGWRIRQVPGTNDCEIKMVHQEDAGLNVELARMAFAKGVWSYVCKMEDALRKYSFRGPQSSMSITAVSLMQKVPSELEATSPATQYESTPRDVVRLQANPERLTRRPSKKLIANGLLLLGGLACLSHGNPNLGANVVVAFILKKFNKRGPSLGQTPPN